MLFNKPRKGLKKIPSKIKGIFYTMDAVLASIMILTCVMFIFYAYVPEERDLDQKQFISQDVLKVLTEMKVSELYYKNNTFILTEFLNGNITDLNTSVINQMGNYWARGYSSKADTLFILSVNNSLSQSTDLKIVFGNSTISTINSTEKYTSKDSISYTRMISGIDQGKPLTGSSGSSYLKKINNKRTSSYAYFGGFVGQGNLTLRLELPSDFLGIVYVSVDSAGAWRIHLAKEMKNVGLKIDLEKIL